MSNRYTLITLGVVITSAALWLGTVLLDARNDANSQSTVVSSVEGELGSEPAEVDPELSHQPIHEVQDENNSESGESSDLPTVYDVIFEVRGSPSVIDDLHTEFRNEPRDEPWAIVMESGIGQHVATHGAGEWAMVEHIDCHSTMCEVAGFLVNGRQKEAEPARLLDGEFGSGWWEGGISVTTRTHIYDDEGVTRFVLIVGRRDKE